MTQRLFSCIKELESIEDDLINRRVKTKALVNFWRGLVRDTNGRWAKYYEEVKYFKYGKQQKPDLSDEKQKDFIIASIEQKKRFLYGLLNKSYLNCQEWLINLHKIQAYKGKGGKCLPGRRISNGEHSVIVKDAILPLAKKYDDSYTNEGIQTLQLEGIDGNGYPKDKWINKNKVIHYYPDPKYYPQYFRILRNKLTAFVENKNSLPIYDQLRIIAEYYQYGINMHYFEEINQSLFFNQVNILLRLLGLERLNHGILDFAAMRLQPRSFLQLFTDEVIKSNPTFKIKSKHFS